MTDGVPAADGVRRLGSLLPDDELRGIRRTSRVRSESSSSGGSSTRARSRFIGASTAARRSPKPRSSTRTIRRRRSTSSSRSTPTSAGELRTRVPGARRTRRLGPDLDDDAMDDPVEPGHRVSSGVRLRGVRRRRPRGDHRRRAGGDASAAPSGAPFDRPVARMKGEELEGIRFQHPLYDARFGRRAGRLRHARARHRRGAHRARSWRRRLPDRHEVRPRDLRAGRTGRPFPRHACELFGGQRVFDANPKVEQALARTRPPLAPRDVLAPVSALLALPQPGDLPRHVAVVRADGRRRRRSPATTARRGRCARRRSTRSTTR